MTTTVKPKKELLGTIAFSQKVNEYQLFDLTNRKQISSKLKLHDNGDCGDLAP